MNINKRQKSLTLPSLSYFAWFCDCVLVLFCLFPLCSCPYCTAFFTVGVWDLGDCNQNQHERTQNSVSKVHQINVRKCCSIGIAQKRWDLVMSNAKSRHRCISDKLQQRSAKCASTLIDMKNEVDGREKEIEACCKFCITVSILWILPFLLLGSKLLDIFLSFRYLESVSFLFGMSQQQKETGSFKQVYI